MTTMARVSIGLGLVLACAAGARAMVIVPAEFGQMVAGSQMVVHGRVVAVEPYETAGRRTIETRVVVQVVDSLKGDAGDEVYFRVPGGQVGRYRRIMVGAPVFRPGDELILFLRGQAPALPMPFGLTQGVYRVNRGADGRSVVTPPVVAGGRTTRGDLARRPADLDQFVTLVRVLAGAPQ